MAEKADPVPTESEPEEWRNLVRGFLTRFYADAGSNATRSWAAFLREHLERREAQASGKVTT